MLATVMTNKEERKQQWEISGSDEIQIVFPGFAGGERVVCEGSSVLADEIVIAREGNNDKADGDHEIRSHECEVCCLE